MINRFFGEYRFLSNFYHCPVKLDGIMYPTVEHAYQAAKCDNIEDRRRILSCITPGEAKLLGKKLVLRHDWDMVKISIMTNLLEQKFGKPLFKEWLLDTGDEELIEGNVWGDIFWGVCNGKGENHLGKLLMQIRTELSSNGKDACFSSK